MATHSILMFGERHRDLFRPPILEVGSRLQPSYTQYSPRSLHPETSQSDYVGIDIEAGEGVDLVLDLTQAAEVDRLGRNRFKTIHCHCVLEHVPEVWTFARHLEQALQVGGMLFVSVPFAWRLHRIPVDCWRFTPQALDYLFPSIAFDPKRCGISTRGHDFHSIDSPPELALGAELDRRPWPLRLAIKALRRLRLDGGLLGTQRALLLESNLMMIGQKCATPTYAFFRKASSVRHPTQ